MEHAEETAGIINNNNDDELPMPDGLAVNRNMPMKFNMIVARRFCRLFRGVYGGDTCLFF